MLEQLRSDPCVVGIVWILDETSLNLIESLLIRPFIFKTKTYRYRQSVAVWSLATACA